MELNGRKVVVIGMARSGVAAVRLLLTKGAIVRAVDEKPMGEVQGITVEPQTEAAFRDADLVVLSPGVPADLDVLAAARTRGIPVIGELELAAPFLKGRTTGVTGTNGKTTTTALTGHILRESGIACQVGGNIGTPPAAMVETSRPDQWNVLELSSFQLETIRTFRAPIAACLNVTQNHLDRHHTFENYAAAKANLFRTQRPKTGDYAVLNWRDDTCHRFSQIAPARKVMFSADEIATLMAPEEVPIPGPHNAENVMAAAAVARIVGIPDAEIAAAVRTFKAVEHRLE